MRYFKISKKIFIASRWISVCACVRVCCVASHQRCLQAKDKNRIEPKQVMPKGEDLSRSLEIKLIWTFDTELPGIFNQTCTLYYFQVCI